MTVYFVFLQLTDHYNVHITKEAIIWSDQLKTLN